MIVRMQLDPAALRSILGNLEELSTIPARTIRKRFAETGPRVVTQQKARCPVDDVDGGQLRDSITHKVSARGGRVELTFIAGGEALKPYIGARAAVVYPIVQELDETLHHRVGGARYMRGPAATEFPRLMARIVEDVNVGVERGGA